MADPAAFWSVDGPKWRDALKTRVRVPTVDPSLRVPRIVHCIWLGSRIPPRLKRVVETWRIMNPEYLHLLWGDEDVPLEHMYNAVAFQKAKNQGQRSDILRYELLYALGGVYVDVDVQSLAPIEPLASSSSFFIGLSNSSVFELNNAVIGSAPCHPCAQALVLQLSSSDLETRPPATVIPASASSPSFMSTIESTGPGYVTRTVLPLVCATTGAMDAARLSQAAETDTEFKMLPQRVSESNMKRLDRMRLALCSAAQRKMETSVEIASAAPTCR
jgi:hypothetical protein